MWWECKENEKTKKARKIIANNIDGEMSKVIKAAVEISGACEQSVRRVYTEIVTLRMRSLAEQNRRAREASKKSEDYYKGRLRQKFFFDDTKLFEKKVLN